MLGWKPGITLLALCLALPVIVVFSFVFQPVGDVWQHLAETVLQDYISNSLLLMLGVAVGTLCIGVTTAWVVSIYEFPGRRIFEWALLLPLAVPAYIIAYTYTGMLDFAGPVQTELRDWFGWSYGDYWFPEIRSLGGGIVMLSLVLYPYVYLLARASFLEQSAGIWEVSRTLQTGPWRYFFRVALPIARPAVITGLSLALMETLADYGTVQYFGIDTFTTGIFRTWFGLDDSAAAAQLSALLMTFVFALILLERWSRRQARYHNSSTRLERMPRKTLQGKQCIAVIAICVIPFTLGFLLPCTQLLVWAIETAKEMVDSTFLELIRNTVVLASSAALIVLVLALIMGYGKRLLPTPLVNFSVRLAGMGYAVPGTVIAIGVMLPFAWIDNTIDAWMMKQFNISTGLLLSGTLFALLFAYAVRFMAVSLQAVESGLGNIKPSIDDAGRCLGLSPGRVLRKIHIPLMRGTVLTAILLVFVDVMKELPATLVLRPFDFNTLAVRAYELASDERLADASTAALAIVITGIIPVILLSHAITQARKERIDATIR